MDNNETVDNNVKQKSLALNHGKYFIPTQAEIEEAIFVADAFNIIYGGDGSESN